MPISMCRPSSAAQRREGPSLADPRAVRETLAPGRAVVGQWRMGDYLLHALVTLFVTIDPLGLAPMFMVLTAGAGPVARRQVAVRASITAALVLVAFAIAGNALLHFLGISLAAVRIAGGLLLFVIAFEM